MRRLVFVLVVGLGCHKGDPQKCEQACRNYAQLVFWQGATAAIEAAPTASRDDLRKQKLAEFSRSLETGIDTCTSKCLSANYDDDVDCMIAAKTADKIKACTKD